MFKEKQYTPLTFAREVLRFNAKDYVMITSFTHHPFYEPFILEIPDNFKSGAYYNLPIDEVINLTTRAIEQGYSLMWDADVSNRDFRQKEGYAMMWKSLPQNGESVNTDGPEEAYDQAKRQALFENLTTQDDHLMHLVGVERSTGGKRFFLVKNSWGEVGPFKGFIHVSESYFAINTISIVMPKAVLDKDLLTRLHLDD
jgi:bleomycin hydrolase